MKVTIRQSFDGDGISIWLWEQKFDGKVHVVKPVDMKLEPIIEGAMTEPTLRIPYTDSVVFMQAMAEELSKNGVKTENDHKIAGTLEATRAHLRDLRSLLKLKELP